MKTTNAKPPPKKISRSENLRQQLQNPNGRLALLQKAFREQKPAVK